MKKIACIIRMGVPAEQEVWRLLEESGFHPFEVHFSSARRTNDHRQVVMLLLKSLCILCDVLCCATLVHYATSLLYIFLFCIEL
jgi:hypothetical protein